MSGVRYEVRGDLVCVPLKVVPGASRSRVVGPLGDRWKVSVAAAPEGGAANEEVRRVLAACLDLPARAIAIVAGASSPRKTASVSGGLAATEIDARLSAAVAAGAAR